MPLSRPPEESSWSVAGDGTPRLALGTEGADERLGSYRQALSQLADA